MEDPKALSLGNISTDEFIFSSQLLDFVSASGKPVANLVSEICHALFGSSPVPICHIEQDTIDCNKIFFYHSLKIGNYNVVGMCFSKKKDAKMDCFNRALQVLFDQYMGNIGLSDVSLYFKNKETFHEIVKLSVLSQFQMLVKSNPRLLKAEKVIAGIVMFNNSRKQLNVLSLATGNKGIRGCFLSARGNTVHDCHAEIIARRGFLRFLYGQIFCFLKNSKKSILELDSSGKLTVRKGLSFHLYVNTAPCGDARVYDRDNVGGTVTDRNSGKMRFKIENGMGTVLGNEEDNPYFNPQTMDGFFGGERLKTMSCTDKILRWNYLGIQGALLSHFLKPIYLSSVVVGDANGLGRIQRGIDTRLSGIPPSSSFSHHSPIIGAGQAPQQQIKNMNFSSNWNVADGAVETLITTTGVTNLSNEASRLCKFKLSILFKKASTTIGRPVPPGFTYRDLKLSNKEYSNASSVFHSWIKKQKYGFWQQKPYDCESFEIV